VVALLDVSVLIALFDHTHTHHDQAHDWFEDQRGDGWATCPVTENGVVRVLTAPAFRNPPYRPVEVIATLNTLRRSGGHHFWPATLSLTDDRVFNHSHIRGHRQVTDVYLLGLATSRRGALATFDRSIHLGAVKGATKANLQIISADPAAPTSADR
jgi:toxin-antitoxin system PIN domain toxin